MDKEYPILKPIGAWYVIGGIVTIMSAVIICLIQFRLGALLAIPALILFLILGINELTTGLNIYSSQAGSFRGIVSASIMTILVRLLFILILFNTVIKITSNSITIVQPSLALDVMAFYLNLVWVIVEGILFVYLSRHREYFMIVETDCSRPDLATCNIRSVSECPQCHEVVETYWQSCPYCGTNLPRVCAECGGDLGEMLMKCPHCGAEIMESESLKKTIKMFEQLTQEKTLPETKAIHYARLAEALLKNGQSDEAVQAYRKAISLTEFPVKRTNFMVQAARILKNTGHSAEANQLLDEAMKIDPLDRAGASKMRSDTASGA